MDKRKTYSERRRKYNSDKTSIQVLKKTHEKLIDYCKVNNLKMKDFLDEIILKNI